MGEKGAKHTGQAASSAQYLELHLKAIEGVTTKKMFGGYGVFCQKKMFAIVNPMGECYLKLNESNKADFEALNMPKHSKMPYAQIPEEVLKNEPLLVDWAKKAIASL